MRYFKDLQQKFDYFIKCAETAVSGPMETSAECGKSTAGCATAWRLLEVLQDGD